MVLSDVTGSFHEELPALFQNHRSGLAGAVRGVLGPAAETGELLQEAFLRAWRALQRGFEPRDPVAWMFVITLNLAKDQRRQRSRRRPSHPLEEVDPMQLRSTESPPDASALQQEALVAARRAIHSLRDAEKEVFLLRVSAGLSFDAIGSALGIPVGTAKTRMRTALARLRGELGSFGPTPQHGRDSR